MLKKLIVKNFALIEYLEIEFHHGFNALTGETGAGKSIIIDAVDIVMGGQGLTEYIRSGEQLAIVEAFFDVFNNASVMTTLQELELLPDKGEFLILSRELVKSGKNITRVNGRSVNLSVYKQITKNLVDIYGQHHQQSLLDAQKHIDLLDAYGGEHLLDRRKEVSLLFEELLVCSQRLKNLESSEKNQARMADIYKYEFEEIERSALFEGEDEKLSQEQKLLSNAEKLWNSCSQIYQLLYDDRQQKTATELMSEALNHLNDISSIDGKAAPLKEALETSLYQVEEVARDIKNYMSTVEADPDRLEEIENRIIHINQLKKKYGNSIEEILAYQKQVAASMALVDNFEEEISKARNEVSIADKNYRNASAKLTQERNVAAKSLKNKITAELTDLNIPNVSFEVSIKTKDSAGPTGSDDIEFLISPNKGEPLKPLAKIVSGGEVSRIMLAFKAILAKADDISTMIFDEVDAGVGGIALQAVARKLSLVGSDRQVICVTHSPQIAAYADNHYQIKKDIISERTVTTVRLMTESERVEEIARMLSGDDITDLTREHAREILINTKLNRTS